MQSILYMDLQLKLLLELPSCCRQSLPGLLCLCLWDEDVVGLEGGRDEQWHTAIPQGFAELVHHTDLFPLC